MPKSKTDYTVIDYLRAMVRMFTELNVNPVAAGYYKWMLKRGKIGKTKPLSKKELKQVKLILGLASVRPAAKQCYYVHQLMALAAHQQGIKVRYMEGLASLTIPVEHAWLEFNGKVVDAVWGTLSHNGSPDRLSADTKCEYYGIEIPIEMIENNILMNDMAESLLQKLYIKESDKK